MTDQLELFSEERRPPWSISNPKPMPDYDWLHMLLVVDPEALSGLRWRVSRGKMTAGAVAGTRGNSRGYWAVRINRSDYRAARLVYFLSTGEDPGYFLVDHINGNIDDNSIGNLRKATASQNQHNAESRAGLSRYCGVSPRKRSGRWRALIYLHNKKRSLGTFDSEEEAARAYDAAARELHGDFARLNFPDDAA